MTVLWHDIINSVSVFLTHVLHKTISPFVVSPLSLLWLQNCVVVSFFDSDYKQIICLILAEVSAFVHVFVSLSLDHEQHWAEICAYFCDWINEAAKLPLCTNSLKLGSQFVKCNWFANIFTPGLEKTYSRVKMFLRDVGDLGTCLRYIKSFHLSPSSSLHPHPVSCNLGQLTMRIMWKSNPRKFNLEKTLNSAASL